MEKDLNQFELAIVNEIAKSNEENFSFIKNHLPYLKVKSRKKTGVGMYVNFEYVQMDESLIARNKDDIALSSYKGLELDVLVYGLNYELNITEGKIDFLELVTNGESWDGEFGNFKFVE
jgi:hypothetical protein